MLIEFSIGNFRSFKDRTTLSMEASQDDWLQESHVFEAGKLRLLKSAAIFGANASGKSNLLDGMGVFRKLVLNSSKESQEGESIPVTPFRLHTATEQAPSHFEVVFLQNGTRYRYGFEVTTEAVMAEWLYSRKNSIRETKLFTRERSSIKPSAEFKEGKGLENRTRENALFLSVAAQFNGENSREVLRWITRFREVSGVEVAGSMHYTASRLGEPVFGRRIRELTRLADVGIEDMKMASIPVGEMSKNLPQEMPEAVKKAVVDSSNIAFTIKTIHKKFNERNEACGHVEFNIKKEGSQGTQKYVALTGPVLHTLEEGSVLFVDELEARLHPLLTRGLVGLFNSAANRNNAQLLFVTHEDNLLDPARTRRDQVWFVEKDRFGASQLSSLVEFKVRKEAKFGKEYLLGQYGGVPHVADFEGVLRELK